MVLFRVTGLMSTQRNYIPFDCKVYASDSEEASASICSETEFGVAFYVE